MENSYEIWNKLQTFDYKFDYFSIREIVNKKNAEEDLKSVLFCLRGFDRKSVLFPVMVNVVFGKIYKVSSLMMVKMTSSKLQG